jgi:hypothetical protein
MVLPLLPNLRVKTKMELQFGDGRARVGYTLSTLVELEFTRELESHPPLELQYTSISHVNLS